MIRIVKFRGFSISKKQWIYGDFLQAPAQKQAWIMDTYCNYEVYPESIGQYTGYRDINGKEIYEDDVLRVDNIGYHDLAVVKFGDGTFDMGYYHFTGFYLEFIGEPNKDISQGENGNPVTEEYCKYYEVIGNIYENPELLEYKEEELLPESEHTSHKFMDMDEIMDGLKKGWAPVIKEMFDTPSSIMERLEKGGK